MAGTAEDLILDGDARGGRHDRGRASTLRAGAVVLTTGTFLNGVIHRGDERIPAGRHGEAPSTGLAADLYGAGLKMGRLKTGTPARLDGRTIAWDRLEMQAGRRRARAVQLPDRPDRRAPDRLRHHPHD